MPTTVRTGTATPELLDAKIRDLTQAATQLDRDLCAAHADVAALAASEDVSSQAAELLGLEPSRRVRERRASLEARERELREALAANDRDRDILRRARAKVLLAAARQAVHDAALPYICALTKVEGTLKTAADAIRDAVAVRDAFELATDTFTSARDQVSPDERPAIPRPPIDAGELRWLFAVWEDRFLGNPSELDQWLAALARVRVQVAALDEGEKRRVAS